MAFRQGGDSQNFPARSARPRRNIFDCREFFNDVTFVVSLSAKARVCTCKLRTPLSTFHPRSVLPFLYVRRFIRCPVKDSYFPPEGGTVCRVIESINRLEITVRRTIVFSIYEEMYATFIRYDSVLASIDWNFSWPTCGSFENIGISGVSCFKEFTAR